VCTLRILILGGTKYIGRKVAFALVSMDDNFVVTISHSQSPLFAKPGYIHIQCDRNSEQAIMYALNYGPFDLVIDFICYNVKDIDEWLPIYTIAKKIIIMSSIGVYSQKRMIKNNTKEGSLNKNEIYDIKENYINKIDIENALLKNIKEKLIILRSTVILGEDDWTMRLNHYIWRLMDGHGLVLKNYGNNIFQWINEKKITEIIIALSSRKDITGIFNVGYITAYKFIDLISYIAFVLGIRNFKILNVIDLPPNIRDPLGKVHCFANVEKLSKIFNLEVDWDMNRLTIMNIAKEKPQNIMDYRTKDEIELLQNNSEMTATFPTKNCISNLAFKIDGNRC
jgi:nucleoside-diphosphate-sugar epimerase